MGICAFGLSRIAAGLSMAALCSWPVVAETAAEKALALQVAQVEADLSGRVGISVLDTGTGLRWTHRGDERFLLNSTVKVPVCAAVLAAEEEGLLALEDAVPVQTKDLVSYAPVTEKHVGGTMTTGDLCLAAIDISDNTAANLLIGQLGGPEAVTAIFRAAGDEVSRLDRLEPELNVESQDGLQDTTTPDAMVDALQAMLLGDLLSPQGRAQLLDWMQPGGVTGGLLRAVVPQDWQVFDKSGAGPASRNLIALVQPAGRAPWIVAIYLGQVPQEMARRNAAVKSLSAAITGLIAG